VAVLVHLRIFGPKTTLSSPKTGILKSSTLVISMTYNQRRSRLVASAGAGEPPNPQMHQNPMETLPLYQATPTAAPAVSTQAHLEIRTMEISTVMTKRRESTDEELELIDMRYQQALALMNLEDLFAEGQLNYM
jgi:hypothetical protein